MPTPDLDSQRRARGSRKCPPLSDAMTAWPWGCFLGFNALPEHEDRGHDLELVDRRGMPVAPHITDQRCRSDARDALRI